MPSVPAQSMLCHCISLSWPLREMGIKLNFGLGCCHCVTRKRGTLNGGSQVGIYLASRGNLDVCACTWEDRSICGFAVWVPLSRQVMSLTTATQVVKINATNAPTDGLHLQSSQPHSHAVVRVPDQVLRPPGSPIS